MGDMTGSNLRRVMAGRGLSLQQVVDQTGLDRRTVQGVLDGSNKPHPRTIHQLAEGLGVSADEFFVSQSQLLYQRFDRQTNPVVEEVIHARPELFGDWTDSDFDELHSRFGAGGALTAEGTLEVVKAMNHRRQLVEKLMLLLETSQAEAVGAFLEVMYEKMVVERG
jgi:transcriptional regulator with XRE-family HTH domain